MTLRSTPDLNPLADPTWLEELVLARLVYDPQFSAQRLDMLCITCEEGGKPEACEDFSNPIHNAAFQGLRVYLKGVGCTGQPVNREYFVQCLQSLSNLGMYVRESEIPLVLEMMGRVLLLRWDHAVGAINSLMPVWLKDRRTRWITNQFQVEQRDGPWLARRLEYEMRVIDQWLLGAEEDTMAGFGHATDNPQPDVPRIRTRLPHYDRVTGGGLGKGEGSMFIAASGVGKTTLACQFCMDFITLSRQKGLFVSTEEPNNLIEARMISNYCTIPITQLSHGARPESFGGMQGQFYAKMRAEINGSNLQVYEWPKDGKCSVTNKLKDDINRAADRMGGIDFVVLDWLGGALGAAEEDPKKIRLQYQAAADYMAQVARDLNIATVSFAAAHPDRGLNKKIVDARALSECKTMHRYMRVVAGISGMLNEEASLEKGDAVFKNEQNLFISKARYGQGGMVPIYRKMEFQQMLDSASAR